jgi:hypothetical protein
MKKRPCDFKGNDIQLFAIILESINGIYDRINLFEGLIAINPSSISIAFEILSIESPLILCPCSKVLSENS